MRFCIAIDRGFLTGIAVGILGTLMYVREQKEPAVGFTPEETTS